MQGTNKDWRARRCDRRGNSLALSVSALFLLISCLIPAGVPAQEKNPFAGDPKAVIAGESQFRANCAFCHGLGARGGGRGPDLTRAQKRHGKTDADLFQTINDGLPGTAMPQNGTTNQGVGMTPQEIWQVITYIRSVEKKSSAFTAGDAKRGEKLFYNSAACFTCHMVAGKGGRLGPELTNLVASRSAESISDSVRNPGSRLAMGLIENTKEFAHEYETVTVVTSEGHTIKGVALNEDNFSVQMMDLEQKLHLFDKTNLKSFQKTRESLMPAYDIQTLPESDLQDILSYLAAVSTK
jgi:cytochrome c oxidase cbb3-type subunit III